MERPTPERIAEVIDHLKDIAPKIPQMTAFGGNNREKIDKQIRILENINRFQDTEDIEAFYDLDPDDDYEMLGELEVAMLWAQGDDCKDGVVDFPESWDSLVGISVKPLDPRDFV
jgi:hypothetical protein